MRIIANYLPQFHRIPENDAWWGEGFTEWTAVKNAKALYEGHYQPKIPLNENYYDLLDKKTMKWQSELMHQYGIDGVAIYHYWFKDGKKLLEKPAENLLQWKDIDMPFCFCWANETWARTWSDAGRWYRNSWADAFEPDKDKDISADSRGILIEQDYGKEEDWIEHFNYLYPFFCDSRYIQVDGKPVILIYKATEIDCLCQMLKCWRDLAKERGLNGIYVIGGGLNKDISGCVDAINYRAPADFDSLNKRFPGRDRHSIPIPYDEAWNTIINRAPIYKSQPYFSGLVGYDTTPRQGNKGTIYEGATPKAFGDFLFKLLHKNHVYGSDITFVNAWNEWGEGMYLEPDTKWGFSFLESVKNARDLYTKNEPKKCFESVSSEFNLLRNSYSDLYSVRRMADANVGIMEKWMSLNENGSDPIEVISAECRGTVAVYGYGVIGKRLCRLLTEKGIKINSIIDRNSRIKLEDIVAKQNPRLICDMSYELEVDVVIIALALVDDEVMTYLNNNDIKRVISISDIIEGMTNGSIKPVG